jgi:hypothetical protein
MVLLLLLLLFVLRCCQVMEQVQDGIGVLYFLLQHHGHTMAVAGGQEGRQAIAMAAKAMLHALQVRVELCLQPGVLNVYINQPPVKQAGRGTLFPHLLPLIVSFSELCF